MCDQNKPAVCTGAALGIGVDLCTVSRIEKAIASEHFVQRVYTDAERAYMEQRKRIRAQSAAAMFAAKEAVSKALGTGMAQGVFFDQIEVTHDELGAPGAVLTGAALERLRAMGGGKVLLSLSHEVDMAIAFAVIQPQADAGNWNG